MAAQITHYDKTGGTVITEKEWTDAVAGATLAAEKFFLKNTGDRPLNAGTFSIVTDVDVDGDDQMRLADDDNDTLSPPPNVEVAVTLAGSGTWTPGTYFAVVTARNAAGETTRSLEVSFVIANADDEADISWDDVPGAVDYRVFLSAVSGVYTTPALAAVITDPTLTANLLSEAVSAGTPPSVNTTGGAAPDYGTEPASFSTTPLSVPALGQGEMWPYWVKRVVPLGTPEAGNDRTCDFEYLEGTV